MEPYRDEIGHKGIFQTISRAQKHVVRRVEIIIPGWPRDRSLRIAFLSDLHAGSHADDLTRLTAIVTEAAAFKPDLVLHGGDFVNMQLFGGGRLSPYAIAKTLAPLDAPLGRFAVLGNHDYNYGADEIAAALVRQGIAVLNDEKHALAFEGRTIELVGLPDTRRLRNRGRALLAGLSSESPTIVLTHDPYWFAYVPTGPHVTLAGHTHGGQIRFPGIGALRNASRAPLRWSYGLVKEAGRHLYVTGGIGTSGIPLRIGAPLNMQYWNLVGDREQKAFNQAACGAAAQYDAEGRHVVRQASKGNPAEIATIRRSAQRPTSDSGPRTNPGRRR